MCQGTNKVKAQNYESKQNFKHYVFEEFVKLFLRPGRQ